MGNHSQAAQPAHHYVFRHSEHEVKRLKAWNVLLALICGFTGSANGAAL